TKKTISSGAPHCDHRDRDEALDAHQHGLAFTIACLGCRRTEPHLPHCPPLDHSHCIDSNCRRLPVDPLTGLNSPPTTSTICCLRFLPQLPRRANCSNG